MNDDEKSTMRVHLRTAFSPSSPIDRMDLFAGRGEQTDMVINAVLQRGQHVILYGERGVGKTSMARVLTELMGNAGIKILNSDTINCDPTDDFSSLWHKALKELTFKIKQVAGFAEPTEIEKNLDSLVQKIVTPDDVRRALSTIRQSVIVFDEFDRIQNKEAKTLMADTIKTLSDHGVNSTLLIVGVAQSVSELIQEHKSTERAIVQVPMPRMTREELVQIIAKAHLNADFVMDEGVKDKIVRLSHGLPHYTHLLSLESGLAAADRGSKKIENSDFTSALARIVKSKRTVADIYYSAISSSHKSSTHKITLLACALAKIDGYGFFQANDVAQTMASLTQEDCSVSDIQKHLTEFTTSKRGNVLQRQGTIRRYKYRFSDPMLQPYVIIQSLAEELITESKLWTLEQSSFE